MSKENNSNPDIEVVLEGDAAETEGSDSFFEDIESQVNGQIQDDEANLSPQPETEQVTRANLDPGATGNEETNWKAEAENLKKRYSDSSREAQRLKTELDEASKYSRYKPLIDHLNTDPSAVEALKSHLSGEMKPQFSEDFVFDAHEAVTDPSSESSKALKQMIDLEADKKVSSRLRHVEAKNAENVQKQRLLAEVDNFKQKTGMDDEQFDDMQNWAQSRELTLEDIYFLKNRGNAADNVASQTKQDMLRQMKSVQNIPQSASNANSAPDERSPDDAVFDILKGMDEGAENLFG